MIISRLKILVIYSSRSRWCAACPMYHQQPLVSTNGCINQWLFNIKVGKLIWCCFEWLLFGWLVRKVFAKYSSVLECFSWFVKTKFQTPFHPLCLGKMHSGWVEELEKSHKNLCMCIAAKYISIICSDHFNFRFFVFNHFYQFVITFIVNFFALIGILL